VASIQLALGERPRKPTQMELLYALLSDGEWHSVIALQRICWRYGARLWDMREHGVQMEKRRLPGTNLEEWRLLP